MDVIIKNLNKCARCRGNHARLEFKPLTNAESPYKWWAMCPITKEPILMARTIRGETGKSRIE